MTEMEWATGSIPTELLYFLRHKRMQRKRRLFACACCRRVWELMTNGRSRRAVEIAEQFCDDEIGKDQLRAFGKNEFRALRILDK
jgi:hypothetical protein